MLSVVLSVRQSGPNILYTLYNITEIAQGAKSSLLEMTFLQFMKSKTLAPFLKSAYKLLNKEIICVKQRQLIVYLKIFQEHSLKFKLH